MDKETELHIISNNSIAAKIHTVRGLQVILDSDLAQLYGVETMRLNEAVKRNQKRFPQRFAFEITKEENYEILKSQNAISNGWGGRRKLPRVFTEQGVSMLSAVLKSDTAVEISVKIIDAFVAMRHLIIDNSGLFQRISNVETKLLEHDEKINVVFQQLEKPKEPKAAMFFEGQMYDAKAQIKDLIASAKSEIIIIDNYTDRKSLDCFVSKRKGVSVRLYTEESHCQICQSEIDDFNQQYGGLMLKYIRNFHDRFLLIDKAKLYHIGASLKDAGKRAFALSVIEDKSIIQSILERVAE